MKNFFLGLLQAAINGAAQTAATAGGQGATLTQTGEAAGAGSIAGVLGFILSHPLHPAVAPAAKAIADTTVPIAPPRATTVK